MTPRFPDVRREDPNARGVPYQRARMYWPGVFVWLAIASYLVGFWLLVIHFVWPGVLLGLWRWLVGAPTSGA